MNTTEIFIEQVFVGAMVLLVAVLSLLPEAVTCMPTLEIPEGVVLGTLLVGLAYILGIVFDRVADTLTGDLEAHNRARFALSIVVDRDVGVWPSRWSDPFPEDRLRTQALRGAQPEVDQLNYLRVRMRLSRALGIFTPALAYALVLGTLRHARVASDGSTCTSLLNATAGADDLLWWLWVIPGAYIGAIVVTATLAAVMGDSTVLEAPRTDDGGKMKKYAKVRGYVSANDVLLDKNPTRIWSLGFDIVRSRLVLAWAVIVYFTFDRISLPDVSITVLTTALTLFGLAFVSTWAWWRISRTFMIFLRNCARFK
jgi:hypothetical protein